MTHNSNRYLKLCQELKNKNIEFDIEVGVRLARGYADLGFEEYYLLSDNKLVSIYLGTTSEYRSEQSAFFFVVPETSDLLAVALEKGFNASMLKFIDTLNWKYAELEYAELNELLLNYILSKC